MKNKIIIVLLVLVVAIGAFIICTNGFNLSTEYGASKKLNIAFRESFELVDVENIAKEVLGEDDIYKIDYLDTFESIVTITAKGATDEEIATLESKLKEKYKTFINEEDDDEEHDHEDETEFVQVFDIPKVNSFDLVKDYIKPMIITSIVVIAFLAIVFRKLGLLKALGLPIEIVIGVIAAYTSIIAIIRIPLNEYVVAFGIFLYGLSLIIVTIYMKYLAEKQILVETKKK